MTGFRTYQECRSTEGWQFVRIHSHSQEDVVYGVLVNPWGEDDEHVCECKAYEYRGKCRHQGEAANRVCRWKDGVYPHQSKQQRALLICPNCGGATKWSLEEVE